MGLHYAITNHHQIQNETDGVTASIPICDKCHSQLSENKLVSIEGCKYHVECVSCDECQEQLSQDHQLHNDKQRLLCHDCYLTNIKCSSNIDISKTCHFCQLDVKDEIHVKIFVDQKRLTTKDTRLEQQMLYFHPDCLKCFNCNETIDYSNNSIFKKQIKTTDDNKHTSGSLKDEVCTFMYCKTCYNSLFTEQCYNCGMPIVDCVVRVNEKNYHSACFRCSEKSCGKKLTCASSSTVKEALFQVHNGMPFCIDCYNFYFSKKCSRCSNPINLNVETGTCNYLMFNKKHYHATCFKCEQPKCDSTIDVNTAFSLVDKRITCQTCAKTFVLALQNNHNNNNPRRNSVNNTNNVLSTAAMNIP